MPLWTAALAASLLPSATTTADSAVPYPHPVAEGGRLCGASAAGGPAATEDSDGQGGSLTPTAQFLLDVRAAARDGLLLTVLAGHVHASRAVSLLDADAAVPGDGEGGGCGGDCMQYVVDAGCFGGYRVVDFIPTPPPSSPSPQPGVAQGKKETSSRL